MGKTLTFAICGTGAMAGRMVAAMRRVPGLSPGPVISADPARAAAFATAHCLTTAADLAEASAKGVTAAYVATRPSRHPAMVRAALAAGLPVLVEKPFALDVGTVEELLAEARSRGLLAMEAIWVLALPAWRVLRTAALEGKLGQPRHLSVRFATPINRDGWPGLFDPTEGGVIADRGVYGLAPALDLFGAVTVLQALAQPDAGGADLSALLQMRHEGGGTSQIMISLEAGSENALTLACSGGVFCLSPWLPAERLAQSATLPVSGMIEGSRLHRMLRGRPVLRRLAGLRPTAAGFHGFGADPYAPLLAHFAATLRSGGVESPWIPPALSVGIARLTERARAEAVRL